MAYTEDLKSSEVKPLEGSSPSSGISNFYKELMRAHEALLMTLHASRNPWIQKVHKNAAAYYYNWKKRYEFESNEKNSK